MQSVFFSSFLIAEFILKNKYFGKGFSRKLIISGILITYLLISVLVVYHNISKDTNSILTVAVV